MTISYSVIFAYGFGIILLYLLGRSLLVPMKVVVKLIYNALLGGVILLVINYFGSMVGFRIPLNIVSALITGFLGIPGLVLLVILKSIF